MNFAVEIQNDKNYPLNPIQLADAAKMVLSQHELHTDSGLTVVLVDDDYIRNLNLQFRGIDAPTDVLSFPADPPPVTIEGEPPYLGDIIIAFPYAGAQAQQLGHALNDSLVLLVVHGTLHLLGYDHNSLANRNAMWSAQEAALVALSIPVSIVPSLEESNH